MKGKWTVRRGRKKKRKSQKGEGLVRMVRKNRKTQKKTKRRQRGGAINPVYVDFKKGVDRTKALIEALKKPVNNEQAKRTVAGYKQEYEAYKNSGGNRNYNSWLLDRGYAERDGVKSCCLM